MLMRAGRMRAKMANECISTMMNFVFVSCIEQTKVYESVHGVFSLLP